MAEERQRPGSPAPTLASPSGAAATPPPVPAGDRFAAAFAQAPLPLYLLRGPELVFEFANSHYRRLVGDRPLAGRSLTDALADHAAGFLDLHRRAYATGQRLVGHELAYAAGLSPTAAAGTAYFNFAIEPLRDTAGAVDGLIVCGFDVTEQVEAKRRLQTSEERMRLAVAISRIGTFEIDLVTDAVTVNEPGRSIYGWPEDEPLTFARVQSHFHPDDREHVMLSVGEALAPGGPGEFDVEQRIVRTDGAARWIRVRGRAMHDGGARDRPTRLIGTYIDVTDRRDAEQRREQVILVERSARAEAERLGRMKDEFLATLSHELRTPLHAILGWARILAESAPDAATVTKGLGVIERNARAQAQLIGDLLDMSRIVSGNVRLEPRPLDARELIAHALEVVRAAADAKGIALHATIDPATPPVRGDADRLGQVLWNLLTNAIKFTPAAGRVEVTARPCAGGVEVAVADTGEGIAAAFVPFVFDKFRQADSSTTRAHGGLGLGLSITRSLVALHGGEIRAESDGVGRGARFRISLPAAAAAGASTAASPPAPDPIDTLAGVTVLVIDDEDDARDLVRHILGRQHARVLAAADAPSALDLVTTGRPTVIVADIGLPGLDGYEFIRRLRELPEDRGGRTPAIALTAFAGAEDRTRALLAGYQLHLAKPIEPAELAAAVGDLARRSAT